MLKSNKTVEFGKCIGLQLLLRLGSGSSVLLSRSGMACIWWSVRMATVARRLVGLHSVALACASQPQ